MKMLSRLVKFANKYADKVMHFGVTFFIVTASGTFKKGWMIIVGIIVATILSIAKEAYDQVSSNSWSWGDILADALGIALALAIYMIEKFF